MRLFGKSHALFNQSVAKPPCEGELYRIGNHGGSVRDIVQDVVKVKLL